MSQVRALHDSLIVLFGLLYESDVRWEGREGNVMCVFVSFLSLTRRGRDWTRGYETTDVAILEWAVRTESSPFSSVLFGEATLDSIRHSSRPPRGRRRPNRIVHSLALLFLRRRALSRG